MGSDKLEVVNFRKGFVFLGEEFNHRYPPTDTHHRRGAPEHRTLYVGEQGARVRISKGRIIVEKGDTELLSVPARHVARIVLAGSVGLSAGARSWSLSQDVSVVFLSARGNLLGSLNSGTPVEASLRRAQYRCTESDKIKLAMARQFVFGKLSNLRTLLLRRNRTINADQIGDIASEIDFYRHQVGSTDDLQQLMGVEGMASRRYWDAFGMLLPDTMPWKGRGRRPPPDLANSALGYGYAILGSEASSALASAGLDISAGFLHADHDRRPSLSLDLMEEYRPVIVDSAILRLIAREELTAAMTRDDPRRTGGVLLTEKGRKRVTSAIEDRMLTVFKYERTGSRVSYRRSMTLQAKSITRSIRNNNSSEYSPVLWR